MAERRTHNLDLPPLPGDDEVLAAVAWVIEHDPRFRRALGATANGVAQRLRVRGASRLGRGAQGPHSWSGTMSGALRISPRLSSLAKRGLLLKLYDNDNYRYCYMLSVAGKERLANA